MSHDNTYGPDGNKPFGKDEVEFANDKEDFSKHQYPRATGVVDSDECPACGETIRKDETDECRHRIILDDVARSHAGYEAAKLCADCWGDVAEFVRGNRR